MARRRRRIRNKPQVSISPKIGYVFIIFIFSLACLFFLFFIDPEVTGAVPFFLIFVFGTVYSFFSLLTDRKMFTLSVSLSVVVFMALSTIGLGNLLNLLLIAGLAAASILWFNQSNR